MGSVSKNVEIKRMQDLRDQKKWLFQYLYLYFVEVVVVLLYLYYRDLYFDYF